MRRALLVLSALALAASACSSGEPSSSGTDEPTVAPTAATTEAPSTTLVSAPWRDVTPPEARPEGHRSHVNDVLRLPDGTLAAAGYRDDVRTGLRTPTVWRSTEGTTWTAEPLPLGDALYGGVNDLAVDDSGRIIVGGTVPGADGGSLPAVWTADEDGWTVSVLSTRAAVDGADDGHGASRGVVSVTIMDGRGVAAREVGGEVTVWRQSETGTWDGEVLDTAEPVDWTPALAAGNGVVVLAGRHGEEAAVWTSRGDADFVMQMTPRPPSGHERSRLSAIMWTGEAFVAGGWSSTPDGTRESLAVRSTDGERWTVIEGSTGPDAFETGDAYLRTAIVDFATGPSGEWVVAAVDGAVIPAFVSTDQGATWEVLPEPDHYRTMDLTTEDVAVASDGDIITVRDSTRRDGAAHSFHRWDGDAWSEVDDAGVLNSGTLPTVESPYRLTIEPEVLLATSAKELDGGRVTTLWRLGEGGIEPALEGLRGFGRLATQGDHLAWLSLQQDPDDQLGVEGVGDLRISSDGGATWQAQPDPLAGSGLTGYVNGIEVDEDGTVSAVLNAIVVGESIADSLEPRLLTVDAAGTAVFTRPAFELRAAGFQFQALGTCHSPAGTRLLVGMDGIAVGEAVTLADGGAFAQLETPGDSASISTCWWRDGWHAIVTQSQPDHRVWLATSPDGRAWEQRDVELPGLAGDVTSLERHEAAGGDLWSASDDDGEKLWWEPTGGAPVRVDEGILGGRLPAVGDWQATVVDGRLLLVMDQAGALRVLERDL